MKTRFTHLLIILLAAFGAAQAQPVSYLWSNGATTPEIVVNPSQTTTYYVTITQNGQQYYDSLVVVVDSAAGLFAQDTVRGCGPLLSLFAPEGQWQSLAWSSGESSNSIQVAASGWYFLDATDTSGCTIRDSVYAELGLPTPVDVGPDRKFCFGSQNIQLNPSISGGIWSGALPVVGNQISLTGIAPGTYGLNYQTVNSLGCIFSDSLFITVKALPQANAGQDFSVCSNSTILVLSGAPAGGVWLGSNVLSDGTYDPSQTGAGFDTLIYKINQNGCDGFDTLVVTVQPAPGLFSVSTVNPSSCAIDNGSATITGISLQPGWKVRWSVNSADSSAFPTLSGLGGGTYQVTITDTLTACFRTEYFSLIDPEVSAPVISGLQASYCSNDSCQALTVSPVFPPGFWSGPGVTAIGDGSARFCPNQAGQGVISIFYQYDPSSGCVGGASVTIQVNPAPTVNAGFFADTLCSDAGPIQLTGFSPSSPPAIWGPQPLVSISGIFNPSLAAIGNNELTLSVTSNGCFGSSTRNMVVEPVPAPVITRNPVGQVCQGQEVKLSVNSGAGITVRRIKWQRNGLVIAGQNSSQLVVSEAGLYRAIVIGAGECGGESAEVQVSFFSNPPDSIIVSGSLNPCSNNLSTLSAPVGTGFTYQWFLGSDSINAATGSSLTPDQSGQYRVRIRNASGCEVFSAFTNLSIRQTPEIQIISPSADTCLQPGKPITISLAASGEGLSFQWFRQGNPDTKLSGQTASSLNGITAPGRYFAVATSSNGCLKYSDTLNIKATVPIMIQDSVILKCEGDSPFQVTGFSPGGCPLLFNGEVLANNLWNPNQAGDFILTYQCTNSNGCVSSKNILIRVTAAPPSNLIVLGPTNLCQGDSVLLQVNNGLEAGYSYQLYRNGLPAGLPFLQPFLRVRQSGNYQVEARFNQCNALSNTVNINFRTIPQAIAGDDLSACGFLSTNLNTGAGITPGEWSGSPRVVTSGEYLSDGFIGCDTLTLTVTQNGCSARDIRVVCIKVQPALEALAQDATACQATDGKAWIAGAPTGFSFSWTKQGSSTVISTTDSLLNAEAGVYQVSITDNSNSCSAIRNVVINTPNNLDAAISGLPDSVCFGSEPIQLAGIVNGTPSDAGVFASFGNRIVDGNVYDPTIPGPLLDTVYFSASLNGCFGFTSKVIKLNPPPVVDAGLDTRICAGDSLELQAIQPSGVALVWTGPQVVGQNLFIPGNGSISSALVTVTYTLNGCSNSDSKLISIDTLPQFNVIPSDVSSCGSCDGTAVREINNGNQFQTIWRNSLNAIIGTGAQVQSLCAGQYSVEVINNSTGCQSKSSFGISGPAVISPFSCLQNLPAGICKDGNPLVLQKCNPDARIFIAGVETDTLKPSVLPPGNVQVILTLTENNGCTGVQQAEIPVFSPPSVEASGSSPVFACTAQAALQLSGYSPAFDPSVPENGWTAPGAPAGFVTRSGLINPSLIASDAQYYLVYTVKTPGLDGCRNSDTLAFRVYRNPVASILPAVGQINLCQGSDTILRANPENPAFTYRWKFGSANPVTVGENSSFQASQAGQYSLEVSNNGCVSQNLSTVQIAFQSIPAPSVSTSGPTSFCTGGSVTLNAPAGLAYLWSNGQTGQSISASTSGNYTVQAISNGCTSAVSQPIVVLASDKPVLAVSSQIMDGEGFKLTGSGAESYEWNVGYYGGPVIGNADTLVVNPSGTQLYTLKGWNDGNVVCFDTAFIVVVGTALSGVQQGLHASLFPNPGRGLYELSIENLHGTAKLEVLDALGRLVYEQEVNSQGLKTRQELDLRAAAVGVYTLRLQTSDGPKYLRLKKE